MGVYILAVIGFLAACLVAGMLAHVAVGLWIHDHRIVLVLSNGRRKIIQATRFSVPTAKEIARIEAETRTPGDPIGDFVHSWYRMRK